MKTPLIGTSQAQIQMEARRTRQTPKPRSTFKEVLREGADVLLAGAQLASGMVGGPLLSAAVGRARAALGTSRSGSLGGAKAGMQDLERLQEEMADMNMFYLRIQQRIQAESRKFTTISNVLKARHDTAKNAINNIRS